jgi:hypothetical protein
VAQSILEVLQREDRWAVLFTRREIQEAGARTLTQLAWCSRGFEDLLERGLISLVCGERYCVTQDFAARAAPRRVHPDRNPDPGGKPDEHARHDARPGRRDVQRISAPAPGPSD